MEASALKYQAGIGLHGRSPLLRLQSDERLITLLRRGNTAAFEVLVARYETRLLTFCRHLLGSREDAEDVLQEVMTAAFNAILADDRPINTRPWLYRIARNRSLNHLRRTQAIGVDSMDHHLAEHGASTADKVHEREEFRMLVTDIHGLPETQRTALVLREMDALSYEQIAEAMETTVSSVKSLLVRARMGLAEAAGARLLSCEEVRIELAEVAEGLMKKPGPLVRRHMKDCERCSEFQTQLKATNKALAALLPVGPLVVFRKLAFLHLGHSAGAGAGATAGSAATATAASSGAGVAIGASGVFGGGSVISAGMGAVATKAAAGLAAAVIVTAGAVEVDQHVTRHPAAAIAAVPQTVPSPIAPVHAYGGRSAAASAASTRLSERQEATAADHATARLQTTATTHASTSSAAPSTTPTTQAATPTVSTAAAPPPTVITTVPAASAPTTASTPTPPATTTVGRVQTQTDPTVLPPPTTAPAPPIVTPVPPVQPVVTATVPTVTPTTASTPTTTTTATATTTTTTTPASTTATEPSTTTTTTTPTNAQPTTATTPASTTTPPPTTTTSTPTP
jgi:RNA polymerase sigma factor (sigma-70 family)